MPVYWHWERLRNEAHTGVDQPSAGYNLRRMVCSGPRGYAGGDVDPTHDGRTKNGAAG